MKDFLLFILLAVAVVVPFRLFIAQPFVVHGESMLPTFTEGEYLIIDQLSYRLGEPARGDVIVFRSPPDPSQFYIKRIIGLPGETVTVDGERVTIESAEGSFVLEDGLTGGTTLGYTRRTLADDEYFVMGDNRPRSSDSRVWGALSRDNIMGRAVLRLLPLSDAGLNPGAERVTP